MNEKVNKEIELFFLDLEDETLEKIKKTYERSLKDVQSKAKELQDEIDELEKNIANDDEIELTKIRSKVYQLEYQRNLSRQISNYLDVIKDNNVNNITDYINKVYSNGFLSEQYRLMANGLNITMPINQKLLEKAVNTTFDDIPLSTRIYENVNKAKKNIIAEISRGLSIGMSNQDMARNLKNSMDVSMRKAFQIAQNEGARVRQSAIYDSMAQAKKKGADIVKQWSATLDGKTRPVHAELDGQYAEIDEDFKYSGGKVFAPKQFGIASEDINCRCTLLTVPRWDIEGKHFQIDNETKELVEVKNYRDWYDNYYDFKYTGEKETEKTFKVLESGYLQKQSNEWYEALDINGKTAIANYTSVDGLYKDMNSALFKESTNVAENVQQAIDDLSKALNTFNLKEDIICYRGASKEEVENLLKYKSGVIKEFKSVSTSLEIAEDFKKYANIDGKIIEYHINSGTSGAYLGSNSSAGNEEEFLINKNAYYKILSEESDILKVEIWTKKQK